MPHNGADPTVGLKNRVDMPHPGQQQNCIFPEISCKYHIYGNSLVSNQNSWSAQRKSLPVYGSSKQVIRFSDSKMHFRWLALKRLPPWRISWWRERLRQKQATTPEFEKQIYLMCLCEIVCNGIWQRQLLILKFEKGFFGRWNNIFLISKYGSIPGGWGVLPYMGYIGTCGGIGYGFWGSRSLNRVSFLTILFLCPWCGPQIG